MPKLKTKTVEIRIAHDKLRIRRSCSKTRAPRVKRVYCVRPVSGSFGVFFSACGVIFAGLSFFFLTFSYDHILHWHTGNLDGITEPLGFLVLTLCLGFVVSRRVAANEAECGRR